MRNGFLFFWVLTAALTSLAPTSFGQTEQIDAITEINGETLTSDNADVYFNAANCADPAATLYDLTLTNGNGITQAYLWAGVQNGLCNENDKRTDTQELCRPMASSTPVNVGDNATIIDLTLQELVDTGIVDCANTALEGQPYEIYAFRSEDPGGNDVTTDGYGVAKFIVDVTPPAPLVIESDLAPAPGSTYNITWATPADSTKIAEYRVYQGDTDDGSAAALTSIRASGTAKSVTVTSGSLNLANGESAYVFVTAVDFASVTLGQGNEGDVADATGTLFTAVGTTGFCDDPSVDCSGCSVSPMSLANGQPASGVWLLGLIFAVVSGWRLRR